MKKNYPYTYDLATGLYARLATQQFWHDSIHKLIHFAGETCDKSPINILDIGCGPGNSTMMIASIFEGAEVTGVDVSENMIRRAKKIKANNKEQRIQFTRADAAHLPFENNHFDLVVGHSFLYMIRNREEVLKELNRVLKPGSVIGFMEPGSSISAIGRSALLKDNIRNPKPRTKFQTKLLLLRIYSSRKGMLTPEPSINLFSEAGFSDFFWKEALGGRALLMRAKKPE